MHDPPHAGTVYHGIRVYDQYNTMMNGAGLSLPPTIAPLTPLSPSVYSNMYLPVQHQYMRDPDCVDAWWSGFDDASTLRVPILGHGVIQTRDTSVSVLCRGCVGWSTEHNEGDPPVMIVPPVNVGMKQDVCMYVCVTVLIEWNKQLLVVTYILHLGMINAFTLRRSTFWRMNEYMDEW